MIEFLAGLFIGVVLAAVGFVWANRSKAAELDAAEQKVRDYKK